METLTLTISLPEDVGTTLTKDAKSSGKGLVEYVETMITAQVKRPSFRELFSDVRESVSISDEELASQIDTSIAESRKERFTKRNKVPYGFAVR